MRKHVHLTEYQRSIVVGALLGDGSSIETFSGRNLRLHVDHCKAQKEYVFWKYNALRSLILTPPQYQNKNRSWRFRTISHPELTEMGKIFYQGRRKIVPKNLDKILTSLGLAVWFTDDGARYKHDNTYVLNTQCFTNREVKTLAAILRMIFHLNNVSLQADKNGWRLHILKRSCKQFKELIEEYMIPDMMYKLENPLETTR